jgi:enamine deaminase RidA (YjgF/YER057c/UK114 family)
VERRAVNPWTWQDPFFFSQAVEVSGWTSVLVCAGQTAIGADGSPPSGDLPEQLGLALDNLETVLREAGYSLGDVVRLTVYTTDMAGFLEHSGILMARLEAADCRPASTWLGVAALAFPELMVELEATAVR